MENVFGIPMHVRTRAEAEQSARKELTFYACMRCEDMPAFQIPEPVRRRNIIERCTVCNRSVWMDQLNYVPGTVVVCLQDLPNGDLEFNAVRDVVDEVRRYYPGSR